MVLRSVEEKVFKFGGSWKVSHICSTMHAANSTRHKSRCRQGKDVEVPFSAMQCHTEARLPEAGQSRANGRTSSTSVPVQMGEDLLHFQPITATSCLPLALLLQLLTHLPKEVQYGIAVQC